MRCAKYQRLAVLPAGGATRTGQGARPTGHDPFSKEEDYPCKAANCAFYARRFRAKVSGMRWYQLIEHQF